MLLLASLVATAQVVEVGSAEKFREEVTQNHSAYIKLTNDIDLTQIGTIDITFTGVIDGKEERGDSVFYHSLGDGKGRVLHPIFTAMEGATLQNLVIRHFRLDWDDDYIGAVAKKAKGCTFKQVVLSDISVFNEDDYAGALVGQAEGCTLNSVKSLGCDVTVDGDHAGGLVGVSSGSTYTDCLNNAFSFVYADGSWGNAYAGGLVGESAQDKFYNCLNFAVVGALDDRIGGIAGYSELSLFSGCSNGGYIVHSDEEDFLILTGQVREHLKAQFDAIKQDLQDNYDVMDAGVTVECITLFGSLGAFTAIGMVWIGMEMAGIVCMAIPAVDLVVLAAGIVLTIVAAILFECEGHDEMGGIVGTGLGTTIDACANYGVCLCRDSDVGGIAGKMDVSRKDYSAKPTIKNCLNTGEVQGYDYVGGIVGNADATTIITGCLNTGKIKASSSTPYAISEYGTCSANYYRSDKYDTSDPTKTGVTEEQLSSGMVAWWLNGGEGTPNSLWRQNIPGDPCPVLDRSHAVVTADKLGARFPVSTLDDLIRLRDVVNAGYKDSYVVYIGADIDCSDIDWVPIGTLEHPFAGICFGGGHTITGIHTPSSYTPQSGIEGVGFFGVVNIGTEVHDLHIGEGTISGGFAVGGIVGCARHPNGKDGTVKITGCSNAADISADYNAGGIIGAIYNDVNMSLTIDCCYNTGDITAVKESAALCGYTKNGATITGCWNTGCVTGYDKGNGFVRGEKRTVRGCYTIDTYPELAQTNVEFFTAEQAKDGTLCYNLNGGSNITNDAEINLPWEQNITTDDYPSSCGYGAKSKGIYASRDISNVYGTVVLPYTVNSDEHIKYYVLSSTTDGDATTLHFHAVETLPAGTPAIFHVVKAGAYDFLSTDYVFGYDAYAALDAGDWTMKGNITLENLVFTDSETLKHLYYISGDQIKSAASKLTIAPLRAYMAGPSRESETAARALSIVFDDEDAPTGLRFVPVTAADGTTVYGLFNLAGKRLDAPTRGINIVRGEKVYNK